MRKRKKKKSIFQSKFYRIYFALVLLALAAIAVGTVWLNGVLRDYESAQPVYVAEDVAKLFEESDYETLYALDTSADQVSEGDRDFYVKSMNELSEGKSVAWSEAFSANANERKYNVTLDGERFASFSLVPSDKTTKKGNRLWTLGSVTTHVMLRKPDPTPSPTPTPEPEPELVLCRITAPKGYTVTVDGVTLDAGNAQTSEKDLFEAGFLPESVPNPAMIEYLYDAVGPSPEIAAADDTGAPVAVNASADKPNTWTCPLNQDEGYRLKYAEAAYSLGRQVAKYISQDAEKKAIQRVCAKGSPAAEIFENLGNRYTTPHKKVSFRNENTSEFYVLNDNCFTCRVSFDYVMDTANGEMVFPTSYTFCVVHDENSAKLYNILMS